MKSKRSFMLMALCLSTLAGLAQNTQSPGQVTEESKTTFKPHWYMQVQAGAAETVGEASFKDLLSPAELFLSDTSLLLYGEYAPVQVAGKQKVNGRHLTIPINSTICKET